MKIFLNIIRWFLTALLSLVLLIVVFQKVSKNTMTIGNIYIFQVVSESMLPEYHVGDIIVVKKVSADQLKIGDDVTYLGTSRAVNGLTITHRIVDITVDDNGERHFVTKGVSNTIEDPEISLENIYGKVIYHTILFSYVGRLMTNLYIYYFMFITVGVSFSYELVSSFFIKDDEPEENDDKAVDDTSDDAILEENSEEHKENTEENTEEVKKSLGMSYNDYVSHLNSDELNETQEEEDNNI